jgi:hypothetical protein
MEALMEFLDTDYLLLFFPTGMLWGGTEGSIHKTGKQKIIACIALIPAVRRQREAGGLCVGGQPEPHSKAL